MKSKTETYLKSEDENGETYYCPINAVSDNRVVTDLEIDECVEASTAGRYSGNLDVANRFAD